MRLRHTLTIGALTLSLLATPVFAQDQAAANEPAKVLKEAGYQEPVKVLKDIVDAPRPPMFSVGPKRTMAVIADVPDLPSIAVVAQPELKLAGLRIHPKYFSASRFSYYPSLALYDIPNAKKLSIKGLPANLNVATMSWSPDQSKLAFNNVDPVSGASTLWIVDAKTQTATQLKNVSLNSVVDSGYEWFGDSSRLLLTLRANNDVRMPAPQTPSGPVMQQTDAQAGVRQLRTYQDLLTNEDDAKLFEHYLTTQLAIANASTGSVEKIGKPALYWNTSVAPGGKEILVTKLQRPFSYVVSANSFPQELSVIDLKGNTVKQIAQVPLIEGLPTGNDAVRTGIRNVSWRNDAPATLVWAEALDGGDPAKEVTERDVVKMQSAPFTTAPRELARLGSRYRGITWSDGQLALLNEYWWKNRKIKQWRIAPDAPNVAPKLLSDRSSEDSYNNPGSEMTMVGPLGKSVLARSSDGKSMFRVGTGASKEGNRPFLDRVDIESQQTQRLFRSQAPYYEAPVALLDPDARTILINRQSVTVPSNVLVVKTGADEASYKVERALTNNVNPFPELSNVRKELIHYVRKDGVKLSGTLYLPPGFEPGKSAPLPVLMWAYPAEFKSADAAGQVTGSPYTFNNISYWGPLPFLARGFAVLDNPSFPIVGEGTAEPNDTYITQLVDDAAAAIDKLVDMKVGDRNRMAIGGHSYGAFMTANLLAHSRLFKAGIARSGAYNRTLTPFGFQSEERNYWTAKDVYRDMSPFNYAEDIKDALLIIHGADDNNPGTFPIQSERLFAAIKGLGGNARLVMLPNESHGYRARESLLHMLAEEDAWLMRYVKP